MSAVANALTRRTRPPAAAGVGFTESTFFPETEDANEAFGDEREPRRTRRSSTLVVNDFYAREHPDTQQAREALTFWAFLSYVL
jgi:hypothetical protein